MKTSTLVAVSDSIKTDDHIQTLCWIVAEEGLEDADMASVSEVFAELMRRARGQETRRYITFALLNIRVQESKKKKK